ncbi:hypothetical protein BS78_01G277100 [Paspalum vaginatum]|nr:hypothetical protein BS78_01G277100 [Paspalum vaginatum]
MKSLPSPPGACRPRLRYEKIPSAPLPFASADKFPSASRRPPATPSERCLRAPKPCPRGVSTSPSRVGVASPHPLAAHSRGVSAPLDRAIRRRPRPARGCALCSAPPVHGPAVESSPPA